MKPKREVRVVLDTCVVVGHAIEQRTACVRAIERLRLHNHRALICPALLDEYRRKLSFDNPQMHALADWRLYNLIPSAVFLRCDDGPVHIKFGPEEDRFHLQLAIDHGARFHITQDGGINTAKREMKQRGVEVVHPSDYSTK